MDAPDADEYLDEAGASEYLKLSRRTLQRLRYHGGGPVYCRLGLTRVVYRRVDLEAWADARRYGSTSEEDRLLGAERVA